MLGDAFELAFEELDTRHEGEHGGEMWEVFRDNYGPSFTLWTSLDEERRAELDEAMEACFEQLPHGRRDQRRAPVHRRHRACARQASSGAATRAAGSRAPRR